MSKVVPFPTLPHFSRDQEERSSEAGRLAAQRRELARRARETMESRPNLRRADERAVVARNLWDILDRVERERGITKAAVLQEARQGSEGDSTKRLPRFALRPGLTDEERQRRTLKLTKGVKKYARIVAAAARLGRLSEDECLLDLLAGTSYGPNDDDPPDVEPWCETLAGLLNALGRAVALDHDLAGYFSFIGKHALRARDGWDGFEHGMSNDPTPFDLSDGGTTELEECRLLPKVYIDDSTVRRGIRAELVPNPVPEPTGKDSWQTRSKIRGLPADGRPFEGVDAIPATVIIERRLWLCLAPIGVGREVVPAFLERRCFSVLADNDGHMLYYLRVPGQPRAGTWIPLHRDPARGEEARFVDALLVKDDPPRERTPLARDGDGEPDDLHYLESVTPFSCRRFLGEESLLSLPDSPGEEEPDGFDIWTVSGIGEAPPHTLAAGVEDNLCHADGEWGIEARLAESAAFRVAALARWRREQEATNVQAREELLRRWSRDRKPEP